MNAGQKELLKIKYLYEHGLSGTLGALAELLQEAGGCEFEVNLIEKLIKTIERKRK